MSQNYAVTSLISTLRERAAAKVPIRTLAEESGLGRGTVFGLIQGQHAISPERARAALINLAQTYEMPYFGRDGVRDVHPARGSDASKLGRWWHDYGLVRKTKFQDLSALRAYRGQTIRVITPTGVERLPLLSDRDADAIRAVSAVMDQGEPLEIVRYRRGRGRRRVR